MTKKFISFCVHHPVSLISILLGTSLWGIFSCFTLEADFVPILSQRKIIISTQYPGLDPLDMEKLVTQPLEEGLASLQGLKLSKSVTRSGLSLINLELHWGTDIDLALVECRELIDLCYHQLPSQCEKPQVILPSSLGEAMMVAIIPRDGDLRYGRYLVEKDIKGRFQRLESCGGVQLVGGEKEEVQVLVDYDAMEAKKLSLEYISERISSSNFQYPVGTIAEGDKEFLVKTLGLYEEIEHLEDLPLLYEDLGLVRLSDVAQVELGSEEKESFFFYGGKEALCLSLSKRDDASPVRLSQQVYDEINQLRRQYGDFYEFIVIKDLSQEVRDSLVSLGISCLVGVVVAAAVILFFLRCWKVSILLASLIPLCGIHVILVLSLAGRTLNLMSLCGMAVGIGMVVDAGTVVLENLNQKLRALSLSSLETSPLSNRAITASTVTRSIPDPVKNLIVEGTLEVALSNTGSALTTGIVFLPLFFLDGLLGELFLDLALGVIAAIAASCILSLSYIPSLYQFIAAKKLRALSSQLESSVDGSKGTIIQQNRRFVTVLEEKYGIFLQRIISRKKLIFLPLGLCILVSAACLFLLEYRLLPEIKEDRVHLQINFPLGSSISSMERVSGEIHHILENQGMMEVAIFGGLESSHFQDLSQPEQNPFILQIMICPPKNLKFNYEDFKSLLEGRNLHVTVLKNQDVLSKILHISEESYVLTLLDSGEDRKILEEKADLFSQFRIVPPLVNEKLMEMSGQNQRNQLVFEPDRLAASRFSTNGLEIATATHHLVAGILASPFFLDGRRIPLRVQLEEGHQRTASELAALNVQLESLRVPLSLLGSFKETPAREILFRHNRQPAVILYPEKEVLQEGVAGEFDKLAQNEPVKLVNVQEEESKEMVANGLVLLIVALLLLYFVMGSQFESFLIPLLLLATLPPALCGAVILTLLTGHTFSMNTVIALVVLFGTAVNNGIILYESVLQQGGFSPSAIVKASVSKLQTLLLTNSTTFFALFPFAIDPMGTNNQASMAVAIVGGLSLSMLLVLVTVPIIFAFYGEILSRKKGEKYE